MLAFQGYFEGGKFVAAAPNKGPIPEHRLAIVTVYDKTVPPADTAKAWQDFFDTIEASDEEMPAEFPLYAKQEKR